MNAMTLRVSLRLAARRRGVRVAAGCALLTSGALAGATVEHALAVRQQAVVADMVTQVRAQRQQAREQVELDAAVRALRSQADAWVQSGTGAETVIERVWASAEAAQVQILTLAREDRMTSGWRLTELRASFHGTYAATRDWLAALQQDAGGLRVQELHLERGRDAQGTLRGVLSLTIVRAAAGGSP